MTQPNKGQQASKPAPVQEEDSTEEAKAVSGPYRVLTSAITVWANKEKKASSRVMRGQIVKLDADYHEIQNLLDLRAIEPASTDSPKGATNARHLVMAANQVGQNNQPDTLPESLPMTPEDAKAPATE